MCPAALDRFTILPLYERGIVIRDLGDRAKSARGFASLAARHSGAP
jgi:hypothetical protein